MIRESASRILAGETIYGICKDLTARGVEAPLGDKWRGPSLRSILISPTAAGQREHHGEFIA